MYNLLYLLMWGCKTLERLLLKSRHYGKLVNMGKKTKLLTGDCYNNVNIAV